MSSEVDDLTIDEHAGLSLRERKRLVAREALSAAALRLAMDKGLENVRVEDIAAEVGVSARTFNNYFSSKEEAICAITIRRNARIGDFLLKRPADEPIWTATINAVVEHYSDIGEPTREFVRRFRMLVSNEALRGEFLKAHGEVERRLAIAVAQRTGTDATSDLGPLLLAGAIASAIRVAMIHWLHHDLVKPMGECVRAALTELADGLPSLTARNQSSLEAKPVSDVHRNHDDEDE
ncbi:MAG TPA: TetR family transcriptional regulator [Pseudonocardiaceae bacterium]|nr:TetR family transcriptional regulator [Pseudonocardiaceae bacterium]